MSWQFIRDWITIVIHGVHGTQCHVANCPLCCHGTHVPRLTNARTRLIRPRFLSRSDNRDKTSVIKGGKGIKNCWKGLFDHCLWYSLRGRCVAAYYPLCPFRGELQRALGSTANSMKCLQPLTITRAPFHRSDIFCSLLEWPANDRKHSWIQHRKNYIVPEGFSRLPLIPTGFHAGRRNATFSRSFHFDGRKKNAVILNNSSFLSEPLQLMYA